MRILFSLTYYTPYISGLTLYIKRLAENLAKSGSIISVITMQFDKELSLEEEINGVRVIRAKPLFRVSKGFISVDWIVKSFKEVKSSDIVFLDLPQFEGIIPAIWAKILRKRLISLYQCDVRLPEDKWFNKYIEYFLFLSHYMTLSLSDKIITHTKDFAVNSSLLRSFPKKIDYVYPPIILSKVDKRIQKIFNNKIGRRPTYLIGVAARLAAEKGIEYLLEAIPFLQSDLNTQAKSFKIVIVGPTDPVGEESYRKMILNLINKYKDLVVLIGEIKPEDMGTFYKNIDVLVVSSINSTDSIATVQLEAMVSGVPVVATDLPGIRVPIQKTGMGIIISIKNPELLAKALVQIVENKKEYVKKKSIAEKEFSLQTTLFAYKNILFGVK